MSKRAGGGIHRGARSLPRSETPALPGQLEFEKSRPSEGLDFDITDDDEDNQLIASQVSGEEEDEGDLEPYVKRAKLAKGSIDPLDLLEQAEALYEEDLQRQGHKTHLENKLHGGYSAPPTSPPHKKGVQPSNRISTRNTILEALQGNQLFNKNTPLSNLYASAAAVEIECFKKSTSDTTYRSLVSNTVLKIRKAASAAAVDTIHPGLQSLLNATTSSNKNDDDVAEDAKQLSITNMMTTLEELVANKSHDKAVSLLQELAKTPINVEMLSGNSKGKRLRQFTKNSNKTIAHAAEYTLDTWKTCIAASQTKP